MESGEGPLVLLCELLLLLVLHVLWDDDCFYYTKPPSGINLWSSILWSLQSLFWFLHRKTGEHRSCFAILYISIRVTLFIFTNVIPLLTSTFQKIPKWWVWYYWICPMAWTVYGLIVSQYRDITEGISVSGELNKIPVKQYIEDHYGFKPDFMGPVAAVLVAFTAFFAFVFAFSIKALNFQTR